MPAIQNVFPSTRRLASPLKNRRKFANGSLSEPVGRSVTLRTAMITSGARKQTSRNTSTGIASAAQRLTSGPPLERPARPNIGRRISMAEGLAVLLRHWVTQAWNGPSIASKLSMRYASLKYAVFSSTFVTARSATTAGFGVEFLFVGPYGIFSETAALLLAHVAQAMNSIATCLFGLPFGT